MKRANPADNPKRGQRVSNRSPTTLTLGRQLLGDAHAESQAGGGEEIPAVHPAEVIGRRWPTAITWHAWPRSVGMPRVRARLLAVPSGRMPSGCPLSTRPCSARCRVPSPPPTTTRSTPSRWRSTCARTSEGASVISTSGSSPSSVSRETISSRLSVPWRAPGFKRSKVRLTAQLWNSGRHIRPSPRAEAVSHITHKGQAVTEGDQEKRWQPPGSCRPSGSSDTTSTSRIASLTRRSPGPSSTAAFSWTLGASSHSLLPASSRSARRPPSVQRATAATYVRWDFPTRPDCAATSSSIQPSASAPAGARPARRRPVPAPRFGPLAETSRHSCR